ACRGPERRLLLAPGPAGTLGFAAYAVDGAGELARLKARLEAAGVPLAPSPSPLFGPEAFAVDDPDGTRLVFGLAAEGREAPPRSPALSGRLQHVVVATPRCEALSRFYTDRLGFVVSDRVYRDDRTLTACFLRSDHEHHSLALFQADAYRLDHHCYETAGWTAIRDWADRFAAQGVPLDWGPGRHGPGNNLFIFVRDPDGNWIELSAELEVVAPDRPAGRWRHEERTLNLWGRAPLRS
ncbi:MAG TPA: VOC family protein, partial [Thermodesulfobacteriota bacterium]|nr:VOC family protein [Thermodesulfobacteriota bacterium]